MSVNYEEMSVNYEEMSVNYEEMSVELRGNVCFKIIIYTRLV